MELEYQVPCLRKPFSEMGEQALLLLFCVSLSGCWLGDCSSPTGSRDLELARRRDVTTPEQEREGHGQRREPDEPQRLARRDALSDGPALTPTSAAALDEEAAITTLRPGARFLRVWCVGGAETAQRRGYRRALWHKLRRELQLGVEFVGHAHDEGRCVALLVLVSFLPPPPPLPPPLIADRCC